MIKVTFSDVDQLACGDGLSFAKSKFADGVQYTLRELKDGGLPEPLISWTAVAAARNQDDARQALCDWAIFCGGVVDKNTSTVDEIIAQIKIRSKEEIKSLILSGQSSKVAKKSVKEKMFKRLLKAFC